MKKIIILTSLCLVAVGALHAQSNTALTYSIGFPVDDLSDFIQKASFRGVNLDYRKMINPNVGVGFSVGWNVFYEEFGEDTYTIDNVSITGKQWRYSNHVPMSINPAYFLKPGETVNPFFGLGIGTVYTRRNTDMNLYTIELESWNFLLSPEIGFQYTIDDATSVHVSARYNNGFKAGDFDSAQSYFSLNVGFAFIK